MKAQSAVFEQVLLFTISVAIFIIALGIFQFYQSYFSSASLSDHTRAVRDIVYNHIAELTQIEDLNASFMLKIPKQLAGEYYTLKINNTEFSVVTQQTGIAAVSNISSLSLGYGGMYTFSGETRSSRGKIIIYKRGHNIILG